MVACENGHTTIVQNLLQNKANINAQDQNGWTPLYFACYYGKTENVHVLLNSNADPNIHNNDNESPLMAAWAKGHVQIVKIMLQVIYICFALISTQNNTKFMLKLIFYSDKAKINHLFRTMMRSI